MFNPYTNPYLMPQQQFSAGGAQPFQSAFQPQIQQASITVAQVPTIDHVEQVQMSPGDRKIVLVQNNPDFLAIRVADNAGFVTTEYRTSQVIDPKTMNSQMQYAPVQAVVELKQEVDRLRKMVEGKPNAKSNSKSSAGAE